jgi:hypothetical protein
MSLADGIKRVAQGGVEVTLEAELEAVKHQAALAAKKRRDDMVTFLKDQLDPSLDNNSSSKTKLKVEAVFLIASKLDERGLLEVCYKAPDGELFTAFLRGKTLIYVTSGW